MSMVTLPHHISLCRQLEINPIPKTNSRIMAKRATMNEALRLKKW